MVPNDNSFKIAALKDGRDEADGEAGQGVATPARLREGGFGCFPSIN